MTKYNYDDYQEYDPDYPGGPYQKDYDKLRERLLYHRIVKWDKHSLTLDDGTKIEIVCSEQDCCAWAGGVWNDVELDAVITDVSNPKSWDVPDDDTHVVAGVVTIFHNQNPIAVADCEGNAGNGGYYGSVCSLRIGDVDYPVLEA